MKEQNHRKCLLSWNWLEAPRYASVTDPILLPFVLVAVQEAEMYTIVSWKLLDVVSQLLSVLIKVLLISEVL